jgi:hypothetical protein
MKWEHHAQSGNGVGTVALFYILTGFNLQTIHFIAIIGL